MSDKIVYRDCINWSNNDHCAKTKCNYCTKDCRDYRKLGGISETENALAELAKGIRVISLWVDSKYENILGKAQRIVAELAKVSDGHWEVICDGPDAYLCKAGDLKVQCAIGRCRAIAEEGVKDGE